MKRAHNAGRVSVMTIARAGIKFMNDSIVYNLVQLKYLGSISQPSGGYEVRK